MALANGMLGWHRNSAFAGTSGAAMTMAEGGFSRCLLFRNITWNTDTLFRGTCGTATAPLPTPAARQ